MLALCSSCQRWVELDARRTAGDPDGPVSVCDDCRDDATGPTARVRSMLPI